MRRAHCPAPDEGGQPLPAWAAVSQLSAPGRRLRPTAKRTTPDQGGTMSKLTRGLVLGAMLAVLSSATAAVAQTVPPDEAVRQFRAGERASTRPAPRPDHTSSGPAGRQLRPRPRRRWRSRVLRVDPGPPGRSLRPARRPRNPRRPAGRPGRRRGASPSPLTPCPSAARPAGRPPTPPPDQITHQPDGAAAPTRQPHRPGSPPSASSSRSTAARAAGSSLARGSRASSHRSPASTSARSRRTRWWNESSAAGSRVAAAVRRSTITAPAFARS